MIPCQSCTDSSKMYGLITEPKMNIVPINQEPNHKCVLENSSLRVFDAYFLPGEVSLYHRHEADSVFICIDGAHVTSEEPNKPLIPRPSIPSHHIYYRPYAQCPFIHRIRNIDTVPFRILDVELLLAQRSSPLLEPLPENFRVTLDNERVRVSCVSLHPGQTTGVMALAGPRLWIALDTGKLDMTSMMDETHKTLDVSPGFLYAEESKTDTMIINIGQETVELVLTELK